MILSTTLVGPRWSKSGEPDSGGWGRFVRFDRSRVYLPGEEAPKPACTAPKVALTGDTIALTYQSANGRSRTAAGTPS